MSPIHLSDTDLIARARSALLWDTERPSSGFYATCAYHLTIVADPTIDTMRTDGTTLWFNPEFARILPESDCRFIVTHNVCHCALQHPFRRGNRNPERYNIACDHVVNLLLKTDGYRVPEDAYCDERFKGWSVDAVYAKLESEQQTGSGDDGDQDGEGDESGAGPGQQPSILPGCSTGDFIDAPAKGQGEDPDGNPTPPPMTAEDWSLVVEEANLASTAAGTMGASTARGIKATRELQTDCWDELKRFIVQAVPSNQSWNRPNRRFVGQSVYLPGPINDTVGQLVIAIDTSGSVTQPMLNTAGKHIGSIAEEIKPESITVIYCDAEINGVEVFAPGDDITLTMKGGGGTRFAPVFSYIDDNDLDPLAVVYITDLHNGREELNEPPMPVLWAHPIWIQNPNKQPFGEYLAIDLDR